ncbi:MFS transporter [Streptomyces sp. Da 82-17]|uniref:MFS transporter n=1 Tax=Streptomyces sp. Da 82-17 TaxID=3377116 RepID=UPI0038D36908
MKPRQAQATAPHPTSQNRPASRKAVLSGASGNALETFDFSVYAYLAVILGAEFFPSADRTVSLLASFAAFGVGFLARPAGAVVFGRLGDRRGRRQVLLVTLLLMGGATLGIALLPGYSTIGVLAPALLVLLRLLQGFSAGGEITTSAAYLVEWAPRGRRGFFGSFMQAGAVAGLLLGSLSVATCYSVLGESQMQEWGWRIPFVIAGCLAPLAYLLRRTTEETPAFSDLVEAQADESSRPARPAMGRFRPVWRAFVFTMFWSVGFYFFLTYMPTFLQREFGVSASQGTWISSLAMVVHMALIPVCGALSDRFGRKPVLLTGCLAFVVVPVPLFGLLSDEPPFVVLFLVVAAVGAMLALYTGPAAATMAEFFPTSSRTSGMAIGYNVASAVFGGFTPYIATWLVASTGARIAPVYYVAGAALIAAGWLALQRETAKADLA